MLFYLTSDNTNRVFLDAKSSWGIIKEIEAFPEYEGNVITRSAWQVARDYVNEFDYFHEPGYGYFHKTSGGKSCHIRQFND